MLDANNLVEIIKRAALDAVNAQQLSDFCYGTVTSEKPLKIIVEQKMELSAAQLVLCRNVTDYKAKVDLTVDGKVWSTETASAHDHQMGGEKDIIIKNGLKMGEKVVLLRKRGGQEYLVIDRAVKA